MPPLDTAGVFRIGGELPVRRLGFGAMRLTGPGVWGPPHDPAAARAVLRRAVELGVDVIDTAGAYGPGYNERLIRTALAPYPNGLVVATKGGMRKTGPSTAQSWGIELDASEGFLRQGVEDSLRDLGVERIDLYQLHRIDPKIPVEDSMGVLARLREEGKIGCIGLSDVGVEQIERARSVVEIATVQNAYNLADRRYDDVLAFCERGAIGFIAFYPLKLGDLAERAELTAIAAREGVTPAQVGLVWLLARSPVLLAIPGTSSVHHLEENMAARAVRLSFEDMAALDGLASADASAGARGKARASRRPAMIPPT
jgi:pyridoxine 4-dehydrogenase